MAYITGTANSLSDLLAALRNACTANGWVLSGNVLRKGTCFAEIIAVPKVGLTTHADFGFLQVRGGNGIDSGNNLTDTPLDYAAAWPACGVIGPNGNDRGVSTYTDWDWPVTYHIHVHASPDEVFLMVNYGAGQYWQGLSFGQSPSPGCPGTGNWVWASNPRRAVDTGTAGRLGGRDTYVVNPQGGCLAAITAAASPEPSLFGPIQRMNRAVAQPPVSSTVYGRMMATRLCGATRAITGIAPVIPAPR